MRIISSWKDYYDFVASLYGGGDPRIVYDRRKLHSPMQINVVVSSLTIEPIYGGWWRHNCWVDWDVKWLLVAGRQFCLISSCVVNGERIYEIASLEKHELFLRDNFFILELNRDKVNRWNADKYRPFVFFTGLFSEANVELLRKVGVPVVMVESVIVKSRSFTRSEFLASKWDIMVCEKIPILKDVGLASYLNPYTLYQEIAYFMGNLIHGSPDLDPPAKVADKYRFLEKGFDLKTSFRGEESVVVKEVI